MTYRTDPLQERFGVRYVNLRAMKVEQRFFDTDVERADWIDEMITDLEILAMTEPREGASL